MFKNTLKYNLRLSVFIQYAVTMEKKCKQFQNEYMLLVSDSLEYCL